MLQGIRVLDLSRVIAGPYCTMLLADLGADVIKLERPGRGDDLRAVRGSGGMNAQFAAINRNKRSIAVDLQHPEGAALALRLAGGVDVLVENFLPGSMERFGLGYEAIRAANPAVVYASITGFGQSGPYARRPTYNTIAQGVSGIMAITGHPGGPPTRLGGTVTDFAAATLAFGAISAALVHRFRTGQGQYLDLNLLAATLGLLPDIVAQYLDSGVAPGRVGNRNAHLAPAEAYRTGDGYLIAVVMNPDQWERFCGVLGDEALRTDPRFVTNADRLANRAELAERIEASLATAATSEWVARFEAAAIACGPIHEFDQVFEDPQVRHLGLATEMEQPGYGRVGMLDFPFKASARPAAAHRPAPRLGQHTADVLAELGLEPAEIERLATVGAIALASETGASV
jgi:glutaryl-CoA transferase